MFWIIVLVLVLFWGGGFAFHIGGDLIHILLVVAVLATLYELLYAAPRRTL